MACGAASRFFLQLICNFFIFVIKTSLKKQQQSILTLWNNFLKQHPEHKNRKIPESFYFCDNEKDANECAELVVNGIKQATATSLWWFEYHKEALPKPGDLAIITDWDGNAKAIIETIKITPTPYNKITAAFAITEGEGDKSLAYWKKVHKAYYTREMKPHNADFDENMMIICEYFKTVYSI